MEEPVPETHVSTPPEKPEQASGQKPVQKPTEYVVLAVVDAEGGIVLRPVQEGQTFSGSTKQQAVRLAASGKPGTYIAVPVASFKAIRFEVEQKPVERFSEVTL